MVTHKWRVTEQMGKTRFQCSNEYCTKPSLIDFGNDQDLELTPMNDAGRMQSLVNHALSLQQYHAGPREDCSDDVCAKLEHAKFKAGDCNRASSGLLRCR